MLGKSGERMTVLAATSGDTGSSAIHGLSGQPGVECFVMFPKGGPSAIQQRQMTTVADANVHCIAVEGDFDDCQRIVKSLFEDRAFRAGVRLGAVNSINWARILAQIVYYFWAYFRVLDDLDKAADDDGKTAINFSVPTGNFGDILAGYYAKRMGLPTDKLVVATNQNDILHRFFETGVYHYTGASVCTPAPSMDISVSSNFERFLYHCSGDDAVETNCMMREFARTRKIEVSQTTYAAAKACMRSGCADDKDMLGTIAAVKRADKDGYVLDPHSACGVAVAVAPTLSGKPNTAAQYLQQQAVRAGTPVVALACAHWAKFPKVYDAALAEGLPQDVADAIKHDLSKVPKVLRELAGLPQRVVTKAPEEAVIRRYVLETLPYVVELGGGGAKKTKKKSEEAAAAGGGKGMWIAAGVVVAVAAVVGVVWSRRKK